MSNNIVVLDVGNSMVKVRSAGGIEDAFDSAIRELTNTQYDDVLNRTQGQPGPEYIRVNGKPYAVGAVAAQYAAKLTRKTGADRYTRDYYGVLMVAALARLYDRSREVAIFASHAPRDLPYRDDLLNAALGDWAVELNERDLSFRVGYANTFEEPTGGLMNVVLREDGQDYQRTDINGSSALVIDIGGHTTDWQAVHPGGKLDALNADSISGGILDVVQSFEHSFRSNNRDVMRGTDSLTAEQLRDALNTGKLKGGGREYHCENEATEAANILLNRIAGSLQSLAGGVFPYNAIVLTGGGCALLESRLRDMLNHGNVVLADTPEKLHLANVRGGLKLWRLMVSQGWV